MCFFRSYKGVTKQFRCSLPPSGISLEDAPQKVCKVLYILCSEIRWQPLGQISRKDFMAVAVAIDDFANEGLLLFVDLVSGEAKGT